MAIKKYFASLDNTITNAYKSDMSTRGTGSNMGASDILEVFSIYGQQNSASSELSRILIEFPINQIQTDRSASVLPTSGNVDFYLRLFNAKHSQTLPSGYRLGIHAIEANWTEGTGLDMENYSDLGECNWINRSVGATWDNEGGDFRNGPGYSFSASMDLGTEDIEVNITSLVERWANDKGHTYGSLPNYGVAI